MAIYCVKNILTLLFLMTFVATLDFLLSTLDFLRPTLDFLLSTLDFYSCLDSRPFYSRPILSTLDPRLLDTLQKQRCQMQGGQSKGLISRPESAKHMFSVFVMRDLEHFLEINSKNTQKSDLTAARK